MNVPSRVANDQFWVSTALQDSLPCLRTERGKFIRGLPLRGKLAEGRVAGLSFHAFWKVIVSSKPRPRQALSLA